MAVKSAIFTHRYTLKELICFYQRRFKGHPLFTVLSVKSMLGRLTDLFHSLKLKKRML